MTRDAALPNDPPWLTRAFADIGLTELPGKQHARRVLDMFKLAGHPQIKDDETAWCSAAMNAWLIESGMPGTKSLMARSWLKYGYSVKAAKAMPRGAICVWPRGNSPTFGHVNVLLQDKDGMLTCIGGNQAKAGTGGAVTISRRKRSELLDARWPAEKPSIVETVKNSKIVKAGATIATVETGDLVSQAVEASDKVAQIKGAAEQVGAIDVLAHLAQSPRFWFGLAVLVIIAGIVYWRWRDHGRQ